MRTPKTSKDKFKNRDYKRTKTRHIKYYTWVSTPQGRAMKVMIALIGDHLSSQDMVLERGFPNYEVMTTYFLKYFPWFSAHYFDTTGRELHAGIIGDRYHKMFYSHNGEKGSGRGEYSREHYHNSKSKLKPYIELVTAWHAKGTAIQYEELKEESRKVVYGIR